MENEELFIIRGCTGQVKNYEAVKSVDLIKSNMIRPFG